MSKKVFFDGIEILTDEGDASARSLLGFVESVIDSLESDLERDDENFRLFINVEFSPNCPPQSSFSVTSLSNNGTRKKVAKILEKTASSVPKISGTVKVDLQIEDC